MTKGRGGPQLKRGLKQKKGHRARVEGRRSEWVAAFWLMAKGWRILGFRYRTPQAEIDLVARKGAVLILVEVKHRRTLAEAVSAVSPDQLARLRRAGDGIAARLMAKHARAKSLVVRLDLIALAPKRLPRHIEDAWPDL